MSYPIAPIVTERLLLDPLRLDDADEIVDVLRDDALHEFTGGQPVTLDELRGRQPTVTTPAARISLTRSSMGNRSGGARDDPRREGGKGAARIRVMAEEQIRFGLRRYPLAVVFFVGSGIGFTAWSRMIEGPTFVFPFGTLDPATARPLLLAIGVAGILYALVISYIRFVRRPAIRLGEDAVSIPVGEFGLSVVTIRVGEVFHVDVGARRAGGWRTCRVSHRGGTLALRSSQLPDDEAFFRVCRKLEALTLQRVRSQSARP